MNTYISLMFAKIYTIEAKTSNNSTELLIFRHHQKYFSRNYTYTNFTLEFILFVIQ